MGAGPLAEEEYAPSDSWRLSPPYAGQTQGFIVSPFGHLEFGSALFLQLPKNAGGAWLTAVRAKVKITDAAGKAAPSAAVAFTYSGLEAMGLDMKTLESFPDPFREGMFQFDRSRRLGDEGPLVIDGGPQWSANMETRVLRDDPVTTTPITVHAVLLVYAADASGLDACRQAAMTELAAQQVQVVREIGLSLQFDKNQVAREHFGFADGVSQPVPFGPEITDSKGMPLGKDRWHAVNAGEILLGHLNGHAELAPGPLVPEDKDPGQVLPNENAPPGFRDLGVNGSFLVVRELRQDVAKFWNSMNKAATGLANPAMSATDLAEHVIGRTLDGDPLSPGGPLKRQGDGPANSFGYLNRDPDGFGCPMGSHMRRANPRDGLTPSPRDGVAITPGFPADTLQAANNHRILRRGRKYGPPIVDKMTDDKQDRGLLFMALNTDLVRQFEFVQQNWMLNTTFATLIDESDPLLGPDSTFTIPGEPLRCRVKVETFIKLVGGDYFFVPSMPALDYLGGLK